MKPDTDSNTLEWHPPETPRKVTITPTGKTKKYTIDYIDHITGESGTETYDVPVDEPNKMRGIR